jgi:hypothetical protein
VFYSPAPDKGTGIGKPPITVADPDRRRFYAKIADVIAVAPSIADALSASTGGGDPSGSTAGGFARGGVIRGPGTGISDSIIALMSNGEFIVNALDTARNLPLLHAINSGANAPRFALGGLVDALSNIMPSGPSFAAGGLVTAGAGGGGGQAPVHLHLGGQTFALHGQPPAPGAGPSRHRNVMGAYQGPPYRRGAGR